MLKFAFLVTFIGGLLVSCQSVISEKQPAGSVGYGYTPTQGARVAFLPSTFSISEGASQDILTLYITSETPCLDQGEIKIALRRVDTIADVPITLKMISGIIPNGQGNIKINAGIGSKGSYKFTASTSCNKATYESSFTFEVTPTK
jgi:hypothetical protein